MRRAPLTRRRLLEATLALGVSALPGCTRTTTDSRKEPMPSKPRMPVLFVGHGSPMNAIEDNPWSRGFRKLASVLPAARAILSISAHWYVPGTFVTGNERPETIHDFGGFPARLYEMQYPAPGDVPLAKRVVELLGAQRSALRNDWGLDHGTWTVLHHMRPSADCPVIQLSLDRGLAPAAHFELGKALAPLRDEGVLILGSGNVTHNLRAFFDASQRGDDSTPTWASMFDAEVARAAEQNDGPALLKLLDSDYGRLAHPTPDHYLPLLYVAGASERDGAQFPITGFDAGSLSMRSILFG